MTKTISSYQKIKEERDKLKALISADILNYVPMKKKEFNDFQKDLLEFVRLRRR